MATQKSDFVDVQLSAAGIREAGENGALRITAAHMSYEFKPGVRVRVLTSEWSRVLSTETLKGEPIFELTPSLLDGAPAGTPAADQIKALRAEEAALQTQIEEGN